MVICSSPEEAKELHKAFLAEYPPHRQSNAGYTLHVVPYSAKLVPGKPSRLAQQVIESNGQTGLRVWEPKGKSFHVEHSRCFMR